MTTKKKLLTLLAIMAVIIVIGVLIIKLNGNDSISIIQEEEDKLQIVTTLYPMYIIGINLANNIENVEVTNITDLNLGCAHDYQLTTNNMKLLSTADVIIINGGGLEGFMEDIIKDYPNLTVIDSSKDIQMLPYGDYDEHNHENYNYSEVEDEDNDISDDEHNDREHMDISNSSHIEDNHNHGDYNPHIWLDPQIYIKQVGNVKDGLLNYIEGISLSSETNSSVLDLSTAIEHNADNYIKEVQLIDDMLLELKYKIADRKSTLDENWGVAIFHDSFAYLANRLGLDVGYSIEINAETALSSSNIRDVIELVKVGRIKYLLADIQYGDTIADRIQAESASRVTLLDTIVSGDGDKSSYINGMEENIKRLDSLIID